MIRLSKVKKGIKYIFSSGTSFLIDLILFTIFNCFIDNIIISTIIARILSSLYNYFMNSRLVFECYSNTSIYKYYLLVVVQMLVSAFLVNGLSSLFIKINDTVLKFFVDIMIFVINYFIQREVVFK